MLVKGFYYSALSSPYIYIGSKDFCDWYFVQEGPTPRDVRFIYRISNHPDSKGEVTFKSIQDRIAENDSRVTYSKAFILVLKEAYNIGLLLDDLTCELR